MDGFFQNRATRPRNDLPVLEKTADGWEETTGHSCIVFRNAQGSAVSIAGGNGGYWLDSGGNLKQGGFGSWMATSRYPVISWNPDNTIGDARTTALAYVSWANKGSGYSVVRVGNSFQNQIVAPTASDEGYIARVDYNPATSLGTAGRTVGAPSGGLSLPDPDVRQGYVTGSSPQTYRGTYDETRHSGNQARHLSHAASVGGSHAGSMCPAGSHPRGEDSLYKIGSGTGRTLSAISWFWQAQLADRYWCRSDGRYPIRYAPNSATGTTCGTGGTPSCPSGVTIPTGNFRAWGRVNCYYTALSIDSSGKCVYPYPVPFCTDNDTGTQRITQRRNWTLTRQTPCRSLSKTTEPRPAPQRPLPRRPQNQTRRPWRPSQP